MLSLLDTNVVSEMMRGRNAQVLSHAAAYRSQHGRFNASDITRYEILRGIRARNATRLLANFLVLSQEIDFLPLTPDVLDVAADVWAHLRNAGQLIGDNDILIAATALHHGLALATGNVAHFSRIPNLTIEDWTQP